MLYIHFGYLTNIGYITYKQCFGEMKKMNKPNLANNSKENSESSVQKNNQLAAIYVSQSAAQEVSIAKQIEACQKYLNSQGILFSGDLFLQKDGTDITELLRARARSNKFDFVVSYLLCRGKSEGYFIGMIVCWNIQESHLNR